MFGCRIFSCRPIIQLFLIAPSGDPMIFYAGKFSASACERFQIFHGQIETDVAIKFTVSWIAGISFVCTPDLTARSGIASECSWPCWCITGTVNGAAWGRGSKEQPMSVDNEPAKIRFL